MSKSIDQALSQRIVQLGLDRSELDNGNWLMVVNGTRIRGVTSVDPGTAAPKMQGHTEDQRMGPAAHLRDRSDMDNRLKVDFETDQLAVVQALLGPQATVLAKAAANAANVIGDATKCSAAAEEMAVADLGHLVLAKVTGPTTYSLTLPRQLYPDIDQTADSFRFSAYNPADGKFYDLAGTDLGGSIAWGPNAYIGQLSVSGMTLGGQIFNYDPSQAYTVNCTDGIGLAEIPEWMEKGNILTKGDEVVIVNCAYQYMQFGTGTSDDSYQVNYPFDANERVFVELYRMLGDAPGGIGRIMKRRVYFNAMPVSVPTEATDGRDGAPTKRSLEFITYPDISKFGDGSPFVDQKFVFSAA